MSNNMSSKQARKDETHSTTGGGGRKPSSQRPPEQSLRCPRCDSTNTKFCYYNNYNLTQPRYFCKTCRRYWTKGGALRNIPIGGGCRKNKKMKSCSSKFVTGGSSSGTGVSSPVMEFQIGGMNMNYPHRVNQFSCSYGDQNTNTVQHNLPFMNLDPLGYTHNQSGGFVVSNAEEMGLTYSNLHHTTSVTSSIESLSSLNQDLHWKLQQQRLMTLFGAGSGGSGDQNSHQREHQKECGLQPILFQNLEASRKDASSGGGGDDGGGVGGLSTEWFFDNRYANMNPTSTGSDQNGNINININNWNGIQAWNHMNHYNALP